MAAVQSRRGVGSLVRASGREWVVLPSQEEDILLLRPLGGTEREATGIYLPLEGDDVSRATFAPPDPATAGDSAPARLLRDAVRLDFRSGAGPFRSLGRIAVEPRPYQLVPLLMALKLDPVRLLIADDVGIGKTIEALLIARELLDRGEIDAARRASARRTSASSGRRSWREVPHRRRARPARHGRTRWSAGCRRGSRSSTSYPFIVVSIDYIKSDRRTGRFHARLPRAGDRRRGAHLRAGRRAGRGGAAAAPPAVARPGRRSEAAPRSWRRRRRTSGKEEAFRSLLTPARSRVRSLP